ncbi:MULTISPECIES: LCP family protein [unclassified Microbacterium]|uniref:LCP family protein n=1 Tax=unclassified Microbacterium TaxID=2609290 RepID=UPI00214AA105|nr:MULTISPECIES: LCP family protein [unclassified Microbacterium]MCR2810570.1 LCP family protein [Microbacterium sp. zg.B185]WIM19554.1 LCP family protein [Microbacterium sp. zg-B185]
MSPTTKPSTRGRRTVARHGELKSPHPVAMLMKILGIFVAVVLVSGAGVAAYALTDLTTSFTEDAVDLEGQESVPPDIGAIEGGVNLFVAGTDACEPAYAGYFGDRCTGPDAEGELNDVNMLVHISDAPRRVTVISFPRDLMIPIPSCTAEDGSETPAMSKQPINTAYSYGGLSCVVKTVSALSEQPIPFAAKVTWGGVIEVTNAVGGVDVCLASGIRDYYTGIDWPAGMRNIQGIEALQFLRTRHGVGDGSDLGRVSNQQQYMSRLARKLVSEDVLSDPGALMKLATTAVDNVTPSKSLTNPLTLVQIALAVKNVPFEEIVFLQYPVVTDPNDPNKVVPNYDSAQAIWDALAANQPLQLTGDAGSNESVVVVEPETPVEPTVPDPSAPPVQESIALPSDITGSTAAQETCSNGNLRD